MNITRGRGKFDKAKADRAVTIARSLHHTHGWYGKPFNLLPDDEAILRELFGRVHADGTRVYRLAYISRARKGAKTELAGVIAINLLFFDDEPSPELYACAGDREQASKVFKTITQMIAQSPALASRADVRKSTKRVLVPSNQGEIVVLSSESETKHGLNPSGVIIDELHVQPNRELFDVMTTGGGTRHQPLVVMITTAGYDESSICYEQYSYAKKVLSGEVKDPSYFAAIHEVPKDADWEDESNWSLANPGLDIFRDRDEMRQLFTRAKHSPAAQNTFRRLYLNQWTQQVERFIDMAVWRQCDGDVPGDLQGGYGGLDLSSRQDLTSFVMLFEQSGQYYAVPRFWIPGANIHERSMHDNVPYEDWVARGLVTATPGDTVDYEIVLRQVVEDCHDHAIREVAYDRWGAAHVIRLLQEHDVSVIEMGQGYAAMSAPTKELSTVIVEGRLNHGGHPVLTEHANNLEVAQDHAGNVRPEKPDRRKTGKRIDGMVALIMAFDRVLRNEGKGPSVYEARGILAYG